MTTHARGVVLTAAELANEGTEVMLDLLCDAGANSVAVSPGVFRVAAEGTGVREPPLDIAGEARVLDRPLWGKRVQHLEGFSPYEPDPQVWREVDFPMPKAAPDHLRVDHAAELIMGARARGLKPYVVVSPTVLPGLPGGQSLASGAGGDGTDKLVRVDGSTPQRQIAGQGCVNNPRVLALARARFIETLTHYPDMEGIFVDWAEYTCYLPEDLFTCFCHHCGRLAEQQGLAWDDVRTGVRQVYDGLGSIVDEDLHRVVAAAPDSIMDALATLTGASDDARLAAHALTRFKADSVQRFFTFARDVVADLGATVEVGANGFAPPWSAVTGMDHAQLSHTVPAVRCKLFTFHWPMMTRWLVDLLLDRNPGLDPALTLQAARTIYQVPAPPGAETDPARLGMPAPQEPHPITMDALVAKLDEAGRRIADGSRLEAYLHSYRPATEFATVLGRVADSKVSGVWIQRFGYLSNEKLEVLRSAWT